MGFYVDVPFSHLEGWRALYTHEQRTPRQQAQYLIVRAVEAYLARERRAQEARDNGADALAMPDTSEDIYA